MFQKNIGIGAINKLLSVNLTLYSKFNNHWLVNAKIRGQCRIFLAGHVGFHPF